MMILSGGKSWLDPQLDVLCGLSLIKDIQIKLFKTKWLGIKLYSLEASLLTWACQTGIPLVGRPWKDLGSGVSKAHKAWIRYYNCLEANSNQGYVNSYYGDMSKTRKATLDDLRHIYESKSHYLCTFNFVL